MARSIIQVRDLRKTYPTGTEAVRGVSFEVKEGEFFGFLGPNGAGKTTTINMLVDLVKRTSGEIEIDGLTLEKNAREIYQRIGFAACEWLIKELKRTVPIWKKEVYADGEIWVEGDASPTETV